MKNLEFYRKKEKLTQREMADKLNIGVSTYNQYENGQRNIPGKIVKSICEILSININEAFIPIKFALREDES